MYTALFCGIIFHDKKYMYYRSPCGHFGGCELVISGITYVGVCGIDKNVLSAFFRFKIKSVLIIVGFTVYQRLLTYIYIVEQT